ncbi:MAG: DnaB-like helicase C-terminal domain-containing protein, partial [Rikenellaceae bacterium]
LRGGAKRPQLSDLRESGAIEQDADIVAFIHRPEYYGIHQTEDGMPTAGMAEIILAKHRNGEVCDIPLRFIKEQARFADVDDLALSGVNTGVTQYEDFASSSNSDMASGGLSSTPLTSGEFDIAPPAFNAEDAPF